MKLFLSYNFDDEPLVQRVSYHLRKQRGLTPYCYADERHTESWIEEVGKHLTDHDIFILFVGKRLGKTQQDEAVKAYKQSNTNSRFKLLLVSLPDSEPVSATLALFDAAAQTIAAPSLNDSSARKIAMDIVRSLAMNWIPDDDLPIGYPFDYEKTIIEEYSKGELSGERIAQGCPRVWPTVTKNEGTIRNRVEASEIGLYRDWDYEKELRREEDPQVVATALTAFDTHHLMTQRLTFPEAGPRKFLYYPAQNRDVPQSDGALQKDQLDQGDERFRVGILVSGGIAPGINAVIAGIVERQFLYAEKGEYKDILRVRGYHNGLSAVSHRGAHYRLLTPGLATSHANLGGSMVGTSRVPEFMDNDNPERRERALKNAVVRLSGDGIEILYIIGGDGSMRAAHALWKTAQDEGVELSVVGIPKTMDNDILWVWQSFGFLSAVERSKEAIQQLHTESQSNPRLCIIQLFGSDSGFVVTHAVTASGVCDLFLTPEAPFTMNRISSYIKAKLRKRYRESEGLESTYGMIVMSETAIPQDANEYLEDPKVGLTKEEKEAIQTHLDNKGRLFGQTPDALRSGGLKLVSRVLQQDISNVNDPYWKSFRVFTNEPRHLIRAIPPSSADVIFGHRLGSLAVDCAMAGYTDFMISQWLTEYVMVPLRLVTLGRKRIPQDGIFYKSARASTGQPAQLI